MPFSPTFWSTKGWKRKAVHFDIECLFETRASHAPRILQQKENLRRFIVVCLWSTYSTTIQVPTHSTLHRSHSKKCSIFYCKKSMENGTCRDRSCASPVSWSRSTWKSAGICASRGGNSIRYTYVAGHDGETEHGTCCCVVAMCMACVHGWTTTGSMCSTTLRTWNVHSNQSASFVSWLHKSTTHCTFTCFRGVHSNTCQTKYRFCSVPFIAPLCCCLPSIVSRQCFSFELCSFS